MCGIAVSIEEKLKPVLMPSYIVLYLLNTLYPQKMLLMIMVCTVLVLLIIDMPYLRNYNKYASLILFILGAGLLIYDGDGVGGWIKALTQNSGVISLLLALPLLGIILKYKDLSINNLYINSAYIKSNFRFYTFTNILSNVLSALLNLAGMTITYDILSKEVKRYPKEIFYKAITRGFGTNVMWSPNFVSLAVVLQYTELPWYRIAPIGFIICIMGNALGVVMAKVHCIVKKDVAATLYMPVEEGDININGEESYRTFGLMALLILVIFSLERISGKTILFVLPIVCFISPIIAAAIVKKIEIFGFVFDGYMKNCKEKINEEMILFTSVGFFGYALGNSGVISYMSPVLSRLNNGNSLVVMLFCMFSIGLLSIVGIHPIISISSMMSIFSKYQLPLSQIQLAISLLTGYFFYALLSPFSNMILVLASISQENPLDVGIKLNLLYSLLFAVLTVLVMTMV